MSDKQANIFPGKFYARDNESTTPDEIAPTDKPDVWICRRVDDYEKGQIPKDAAFTKCSLCIYMVVYNPATKLAAPKVCMQCEGIEPLPIEAAQ